MLKKQNFFLFHRYQPEVYYPKPTSNTLYRNLIEQCKHFEIPIITSCPPLEDLNLKYSLVIDALFGFSFKPPVRQEFQEIMQKLYQTSTPCCSIDIPSGTVGKTSKLDIYNSKQYFYQSLISNSNSFAYRLGCRNRTMW